MVARWTSDRLGRKRSHTDFVQRDRQTLGWRLAHGEFKEHSSTHGQRFWVLDDLALRRADGTECEAILWDLAGQTDYRLIHALFLDDADLALLLLDPTDTRDPMHGVEFWLKQLRVAAEAGGASAELPPAVLVGARLDRGIPTVTSEELAAFCRERGIRGGHVGTSAKSGEGGQRLAAVVASRPGVTDVRIYDTARGAATRLTSNQGSSAPVWNGDDTEVVFVSSHEGRRRILRRGVDSAEEPELLYETENPCAPSSWSADGRWLLLSEKRPRTGWDVLVLDLDSGSGSPAS